MSDGPCVESGARGGAWRRRLPGPRGRPATPPSPASTVPRDALPPQLIPAVSHLAPRLVVLITQDWPETHSARNSWVRGSPWPTPATAVRPPDPTTDGGAPGPAWVPRSRLPPHRAPRLALSFIAMRCGADRDRGTLTANVAPRHRRPLTSPRIAPEGTLSRNTR